ncbi:MAG: EAL domain-containing protein [Nitrospirae bacterium]|nr:EAL domain-containing protein [Nitrospirota bacterium]
MAPRKKTVNRKRRRTAVRRSISRPPNHPPPSPLPIAPPVSDSQRMLATLMSNLPGMVYRCLNDRDWTLEFVSDGVLPLTGYRQDELTGKGAVSYGQQIIHPDDQQAVWDQVQAALEQRQPYQLVYRIRTKAGEEKWVWEQGCGIFAAGGALLALEGFITNITDRKRVEEDLRSGHRLFQLLAEFHLLASGQRIGDLARAALSFIEERLGFQHATIALFLPKREGFRILEARHRDTTGFDEGVFLPMKDAVVSEVIEGTRPLYRPDIAAERGHAAINRKLLDAGLQSDFLVPLWNEGKCLGTLNIASTRRDGFTQADRDCLTLMAPQLAQSIDQAMLLERLQESETWLSKAQHVAHVGSWERVFETDTIRWSDELFRIFGFAPQAFVPTMDKLAQCIHPDDRQQVTQAIEATLSSGQLYNAHYRIVRPDGSERMIHSQGEATFDAAGKPVRMFGTVQDVTELKLAEAAIVESEQRFRTLVKNSPDVIMQVTRDGTILFINYTLPDYTIEQVIGTSVVNYLSEEDSRLYLRMLDEVFETGESRSFEVSAAGPTQWLTRLVPLRQNGQIEAAMVIATNITDRRNVEQELGTRARQQAAVAALGQRGLAGSDFSEFMQDVVETVARTLNVDYCKVLQLQSDGGALLLRAGVGWRGGAVGRAMMSAGPDSQAGYTLQASEPVIVDRLELETRFRGPALLQEHGVVSGVSVVIPGAKRPFGVLGAHTATRRRFTQDDCHFLQAVANLIHAMLDRTRREEQLRDIAQGVAGRYGEEYFRLVVQHLARVLDVEYTVIGRLSETGRELQTLAVYANGSIVGNLVRPLEGTPCELVASGRLCYYPSDVLRQFPNDRWLAELGVSSYIGTPLFDAAGRPIGLLMAVSRLPILNGEEAQSLLQIFAVQVSAELGRAQAEATLVKLSSAVEQSAESVFITDRDGVIEYVNPAFEELLGYTREEAIGQNARLLKSGHHSGRFYESLWETILTGHPFRAVFVNAKKNGDIYYEDKTITPIRDRGGNLTHFVSVGRDITERKRSTEARERLAAILEATTDFVGTVDANGTFLYLNQAGRTMLGLGAREPAAGLQIATCHPQWAAAVILNEAIPKAIKQGVWSGESVLLSRDGREIPVSQVILAHKTEDGSVEYLSTIARDISERKAQTAALEYQANHDALTALPNRNLLNDRLRQAILAAQRDHHSLALLVLDLDRFKEINDTLGHHHGDLLLKEVGPRLRAALRESDTIARLGGDEFAVLLPTADQEGAVMTSQKILQTLEKPFALDELALDVEASIGIALFPEHGLDAETIMRRADIAMYTAKQAGSGYALYASEHDQYTHRRFSLMGELRHAIERNQLFLNYQPTVNLKQGQVVGAEALLRWRHPKYGLVPPDQFIVLAEQTGLIKPLTDFVIEAALEQARAWMREGLSLSISVNLSARSLHDPTFADQIDKRLLEFGIPPRLLDMEITESAIMSDPDHAMEILSSLSIMGVRLAIDDFGVGHSSLTYLKKLPVHEIKIDKSFVLNMSEDPDDAMIVRSIIDLGHNQGLKVVAEGVQSQQTLDRLVELGCDLVQGYFISRPISAEELTRWVTTSPWTIAKV